MTWKKECTCTNFVIMILSHSVVGKYDSIIGNYLTVLGKYTVYIMTIITCKENA